MAVTRSSPHEPRRALDPSPLGIAPLLLCGLLVGCYQGSSAPAWSDSDGDPSPDAVDEPIDETSEEPSPDEDEDGDDNDPEPPEPPEPEPEPEPPEPPPYEPARYPGHHVHSPVTPYVADQLRQIAARNPDQADDVFMKTGASSTVSTKTLHCFIDEAINLGDHEHLQPALDYYAGGDAAGTTPFDRHTEAAKVGHHAGWAISGDPSPIDLEAELLSPRLALVHFGTNDMGWGATYGDALLYFHSNMMPMLDGLIAQGIVPIVFGITRRGDYASAQRWVDTWNAALRGIAQSRQVPFVDMFEAIDGLAEHGLAGDGLHLNAYPGGACVLDEEGLQYGYNVRNQIALEVLDRVHAVMVEEQPGLDAPTLPMDGAGTPDAPWVIEGLPFTDVRNTDQQGAPFVDEYSGCSTADESGPELWYRLEVEQTTRIRAAVLDGDGVDIDLHLTGAEASGEGCLARGDSFVETTLTPGTYHFALDTWVSDDTAWTGEFVFLLVECDDDDASCNP